MRARILFSGSGYGPPNLSALASMGRSVTCVDMSEDLLTSYIRARTHDLPGHVETIVSDMNSLDVQGSYDVILFFESFHHCADHLGLLRKLPDLLEPGGAVVFAGRTHRSENTPLCRTHGGYALTGSACGCESSRVARTRIRGYLSAQLARKAPDGALFGNQAALFQQWESGSQSEPPKTAALHDRLRAHRGRSGKLRIERCIRKWISCLH